MHTQTLINNIESLSATLDEGQLAKFLDIMDAMALLLAEAQQKRDELPTLTPAATPSAQPEVH